MIKSKLISVKQETKEKLDDLKLCADESYNSILERVLFPWMKTLKIKLETEASASDPNSQQHESTNNST